MNLNKFFITTTFESLLRKWHKNNGLLLRVVLNRISKVILIIIRNSLEKEE
jgi:hypothetical protein